MENISTYTDFKNLICSYEEEKPFHIDLVKEDVKRNKEFLKFEEEVDYSSFNVKIQSKFFIMWLILNKEKYVQEVRIARRKYDMFVTNAPRSKKLVFEYIRYLVDDAKMEKAIYNKERRKIYLMWIASIEKLKRIFNKERYSFEESFKDYWGVDHHKVTIHDSVTKFKFEVDEERLLRIFYHNKEKVLIDFLNYLEKPHCKSNTGVEWNVLRQNLEEV